MFCLYLAVVQTVVQTLYPADVGNTKMHYQKRCDSFNRKFTC